MKKRPNIIIFNPDEMRFDCDGEKLSLTISFDVN